MSITYPGNRPTEQKPSHLVGAYWVDQTISHVEEFNADQLVKDVIEEASLKVTKRVHSAYNHPLPQSHTFTAHAVHHPVRLYDTCLQAPHQT